ncbi:MAG TPA: SRPBCC family protein [Sphingomicrobium sp.]
MEFDVSRHIGAITRQVVDGERDGKPTRIVRASRSFRTDIDDTWDAVTNPARIPRWFSPVSGNLKPGGRYQIEGNAGGTIEECDPPRRLSLTWEFGGGVSWVAVNLVEEAGGTRLELEHMAPLDDKSEEFWNQYGPGAVGIGWDLSFLGLAEHLEHGWDKPPETDTEWVKSDNYKAFARGSSTSWRDASIAYGTETQAATEAADRTTQFYGA